MFWTRVHCCAPLARLCNYGAIHRQPLSRIFYSTFKLNGNILAYENRCGNVCLHNNLNRLTFKPDVSASFTVRCKRGCCTTVDFEIPSYLLDNIIEVKNMDDFVDLNWMQNEMENEINDFLTSRAIPFYEIDDSFVVKCPACEELQEDITYSEDLLVDRKSGYFVCSSCHKSGTWSELTLLYDSACDSLSRNQLYSFLVSLQPITSAANGRLALSGYKNLDIDFLNKCGCRLSEDGSMLIIPVLNCSQQCCEQPALREYVGYFGISLQNNLQKVVTRFLKDEGCAWSSLCFNNSTAAEIVVVSHICEALYLAQHGLNALTIPSAVRRWCQSAETESVNVFGLTSKIRRVLLWKNKNSISLPSEFFKLISKNSTSFAVVYQHGNRSVYDLSLNNILEKLQRSVKPLTLTDESITVEAFQQQLIFDSLYRYQEHGVSFTRYKDLQAILLGHRQSEVTVLSGPTGVGKTTFAAEYSLDLAMQGVSTLWASLEISSQRLMKVLLQQFSGKPLPMDPRLLKALICRFQHVPIRLLDLYGQQNMDAFMQKVLTTTIMCGVHHLVVDNLQFMVGCPENAVDRWHLQDRAMSLLRQFATNNRCHVTIIVHPRKLQENEVLSIQSISGGARVTQEADNVLLLQMQRGAKPGNNRKAIEVVKNRYAGHLGVFPLKFHSESLTMSGCFN